MTGDFIMGVVLGLIVGAALAWWVAWDRHTEDRKFEEMRREANRVDYGLPTVIHHRAAPYDHEQEGL